MSFNIKRHIHARVIFRQTLDAHFIPAFFSLSLLLSLSLSVTHTHKHTLRSTYLLKCCSRKFVSSFGCFSTEYYVLLFSFLIYFRPDYLFRPPTLLSVSQSFILSLCLSLLASVQRFMYSVFTKDRDTLDEKVQARYTKVNVTLYCFLTRKGILSSPLAEFYCCSRTGSEKRLSQRYV